MKFMFSSMSQIAYINTLSMEYVEKKFGTYCDHRTGGIPGEFYSEWTHVNDGRLLHRVFQYREHSFKDPRRGSTEIHHHVCGFEVERFYFEDDVKAAFTEFKARIAACAPVQIPLFWYFGIFCC